MPGFQRNILCTGPEVLHQHVVADRIYKWSQPVSLPDASIRPQQPDHSGKGLLLHVVNHFRRQKPRPQFDLDQF